MFTTIVIFKYRKKIKPEPVLQQKALSWSLVPLAIITSLFIYYIASELAVYVISDEMILTYSEALQIGIVNTAVCLFTLLQLAFFYVIFSRYIPLDLGVSIPTKGWITLSSILIGCFFIFASEHIGLLVYFSDALETILAAGESTGTLDGTALEEDYYDDKDYTHPLIILATIILIPISEEFLARGLFYSLIQLSPLSNMGAIVGSTALFCYWHLHYDIDGIIFVAFSGLVLGLVRYYTKSLRPCIYIHCIINALILLY